MGYRWGWGEWPLLHAVLRIKVNNYFCCCLKKLINGGVGRELGETIIGLFIKITVILRKKISVGILT